MRYSRTVIVGMSVLGSLAFVAVLVLHLSQGEIGTCPLGSFQCGNSSECILQKYICNGQEDCRGGEDEKNSECVDWEGGYTTIMKKLTPDFTTEQCNLTSYPKGCTCNEFAELMCVGAGFKSVPKNIPAEVTALNFMGNSLTTLTKDSLSGLTELKLLALEKNKISGLPHDVFWNTRNLKMIMLMDNDLTEFEEGTFAGLTRLNILFVGQNKLTKLNLHSWRDLIGLYILDLSYNRLELKDEVFPALKDLLYLELGNNLIEEIDDEMFANLTNLIQLSLKHNRIVHISENAFAPLHSIDYLDLSSNRLHVFSSKLLKPFRALNSLNLGYNPLDYVQSEAFTSLKNLTTLDLQDIDIEKIDVNMFEHLKSLEFVYFKRFHYCSYAPTVPKCKPNTDGVSSFNHLLVKPVLRITVWVIAFFTCFANILVLYGRHYVHEDNKAVGFVVKNLAISDLLIGFYLLAIGYHDLAYRGVYNKKAHAWMTSWQCTAIGVLAMTSSEVSLLILVFMSLDRLFSIAISFKNAVLSPEKAKACIIAIWLLGVFIAIIPVILWRAKSKFYGANGLCFPLHIDDPFFLGWQYSAFVFLGINLLGLILISVFYSIMFLKMSNTRKNTPINIKNIKEYEVAIRCFFFVLADAGCWLPIFVLKILAFLNVPISADLYAWVAVFVLPVNSAINPVLYTFTTRKYRNFVFQLFQTKKSLIWKMGYKKQSSYETESSGISIAKQLLNPPLP